MSLERIVPDSDHWDKYKADHLQRYNFFASLYNGKDVLDMACGAGYGSDIIAANAKSILGIDVSKEAINLATGRFKKRNLAFVEVDYLDVPSISQTFDLVVSFETIEHIQDPQSLIEIAHRVLRPGGKLICSTPNKAKYSAVGRQNPFHVSELYYEEFKKLFSKYFLIDKEFHQTENVNYQRVELLKQELKRVQSVYEGLIQTKFNRLLKGLIGKKNNVETLYEKCFYPTEADFDLEEMKSFNQEYSVIILEGTKI